MKLRKLKMKDAPLMLEWMHDESVIKDMQTDFRSKTQQDCERFIQVSQNTELDFHLAIANDLDEYMGTVSLKHIMNKTAEFAIAVRCCAMGKGYSKYGMTEIIRKGFDELGLNSVYWCVNPDNYRAIRFYEKNGYKQINGRLLSIRGGYSEEQIQKYIWYKEAWEGGGIIG